MNRYLRFFLFALPIAAALGLSYFHVFDLYELQTYDWRCKMRGARPVSPDIVIVEIGDQTLAEIGKWPFDRQYHAQLIEDLASLGARAVVFDILFVEPSPSDGLVEETAQRAGNVYFADAVSEPRQEGSGLIIKKVLEPVLPSFESAAKGVGYVNVVTDIDGKRRRVFPYVSYNGQERFHLSFRVAMDILGLGPGDVRSLSRKKLRFGNAEIPLDGRGNLLINFANTWEKTFRHYSYVEILYAYEQKVRGEQPILNLEELKGKICIVGLTATGAHDTGPIPIQPAYPLMGLYANVLNMLLEGDFLWRFGPWPNLLILILLGGWVLWLASRFKPLVAFGATLLSLFAYVGIAMLVFFAAGIWIDLFYPCVLVIVIYAVATLSRTMFEMRKRELIERELQIASQIQKSFLPETLPQEKGLEVAVFMKPAKAVGGDLYTFVSLGGGKLGVMVGDVSGKGTPAALFMAKSVSEFKFSARGKEDPATVLVGVNDSIASESTGGLFVTIAYAIFDLKNRQAVLSNGGHLPVVAVDAQGGRRLLSADGGMPIGVLPGASFSAEKTPLKAGDCYAFYSDGVSEARNRKKEEFGTQALESVILSSREKPAQAILDRAVETLMGFIGKADQHDDITLIIVKIVE